MVVRNCNGLGSGAGFSMPKPDSRASPHDPNLAHLINGFFFTSNPSPQAPSCHAWPKIKNTNYKYTNLWFMIFRPKIINTNTNINTERTNTNFRFMIFPFKITNTNTNPNTNTNTNTEFINTNTNWHDWDELNPEKKKCRTRWSEAMRG